MASARPLAAEITIGFILTKQPPHPPNKGLAVPHPRPCPYLSVCHPRVGPQLAAGVAHAPAERAHLCGCGGEGEGARGGARPSGKGGPSAGSSAIGPAADPRRWRGVNPCPRAWGPDAAACTARPAALHLPGPLTSANLAAARSQLSYSVRQPSSGGGKVAISACGEAAALWVRACMGAGGAAPRVGGRFVRGARGRTARWRAAGHAQRAAPGRRWLYNRPTYLYTSQLASLSVSGSGTAYTPSEGCPASRSWLPNTILRVSELRC
jgi:hypothetical protein